jgi:phosphatidylinositol 3-kinase
VSAYLDTLSDAVLSSFLLQLVQAMRPERSAAHRPVSDLLIRRARHAKLFGSRFFWYMKVEAEFEDDDGAWYKSMTLEFLDSVRSSDEPLYTIYRRQDGLVKSLRELYRYISERGKNNRLEMQDLMQKEISAGKFMQLKSFEPLPFPLNPSIEVFFPFFFCIFVVSFLFLLFQVKGMIPSRCSVFKSAQKPLGLCFEKVDGSPFMVLFKLGDDLRCDQLVLQLISLMDDMLQRDGNLDLCLSPYRVLATGKNDGMVEIVPDSISVAACLKNNDNDIAAYFKKLHPSDSGPFGIDAKVLDNFVRSCAGYGVIT